MTLATFLLPALALTLVSVALILLALRRGAAVQAQDQDRAVRIYADQLAEIERDSTRGLVSPAEAERLRVETARRLLDADKAQRTDLAQSPRAARRVMALLIAGTLAVTGGVYWMAGAPLYPDQPLAQRYEEAARTRAARPDQAALVERWETSDAFIPAPEPSAEDAELVAQLRAVVAQRPNDPQGLRFLATSEDALGNYSEAADLWSRLAALAVEAGQSPVPALENQARSMIFAAGGVVSPQAEAVIQRVLTLDADNGLGRYYLGLSFMQTGRPDLTFRLWRGLLQDSPPNAPWVTPIRGLIEDLAQVAGVRYTLPPIEAMGARGPSATDIEAAGQLAPQERAEMIGGMVDGLAARLASQGGTAQEWARLISALGVLGETQRARAIWAEARVVFSGDEAGLSLINAAAQAQGLAQPATDTE